MKIRMSHSPMFDNDHEHGVFCRCGYSLFFDEKDLTPPVTKIVCPNCSSEIYYYTPSLTEQDIFKKGNAR